MIDRRPALHLLAGPNGAGKSTIYEFVLGDILVGLPFVNADLIAAERWPDGEPERAYEAARVAADQRATLIGERRSFVTETVFSHPSKLDLVRDARAAGFHVSLHIVVVPVDLAVARVRARGADGGHEVPAEKIRQRYERLWSIVRRAVTVANRSIVYDNAGRRPVQVAGFTLGSLTWQAEQLPEWYPVELRG